MGEVKRYDMLIDYGCSKFDSPEIDPHEIKDGYWVMHSDYATLEAERAASEAACAAKHDALGQLFAFVQSNEAEDTPSLRLFAACVAALSPDADKNYIDATGAVEALVIATDTECIDGVTTVNVAAVMKRVPADWAGSTVKSERVP